MVIAIEDLPIEETEPSDEDEGQDIRFDIMPYPADYTVKGLYEKWESGQLVVPDYQRNYVWSETQASRFIESFLLGLPVPQVFLYRDRSDPKLTVIDGQQRISTIAKFYNGDFRLRGVNSRWVGMKYGDLSDYDRSELDEATLRAIVIRQIQPNNNSSVYQIFRRLNTGGTQLNDMEIRRAIFRGNANEFLTKLNENPDWRDIIGMSESSLRFRDVELVLRVLALSSGWRSYAKPMKEFITGYMTFLDSADANILGELEKRFRDSCQAIRSNLGPKPFHLRNNRLNLAALDSVVACSVEVGESLTTDLAKGYDELKEDLDYVEFVTHNTSDNVAVSGRFEKVHSAFSSELHG